MHCWAWQDGAAMLENSLAVPQNIQHRVTICNSTPRHLLRRNKNINPLVHTIHSSTTHNNQKVESTKMSINWCTDKENVTCLWSVTLQQKGMKLWCMLKHDEPQVRETRFKWPHIIWHYSCEISRNRDIYTELVLHIHGLHTVDSTNLGLKKFKQTKKFSVTSKRQTLNLPGVAIYITFTCIR